jgi:PKD repeat protein
LKPGKEFILLNRLFFIVICVLFTTSAAAQSVTRGPYLQQQDDESIIVRWRTDIATDSEVRYGLTSASLNLTETVAGSTTEHTVKITGLSPLTTYYYSIGNSGGILAGDDSYFFHTSPTPGVAAPTRFWAIGDSGTNTLAQTSHVGKAIAVRDAFKTYTAARPADFMMMLGDNAYNDGTDPEYQEAVFETYPELLRQLPLWSTLGNHDGHSADSNGETGPYYEIFDLPRAAEVGGYPSGTEAYHSWDYGNIHFINLESYETDRSVGGAMLNWLEADLMMNDKPWVIAIWHHPPYTKGSHDSDTETELVQMRQNALPILEAWGVDLVMSGHSHSYERSYLLDGHYGISDTLNTITEVLDGGNGNASGDGAYEKPPTVAAENYGAVYAVAGSSGKVSALKPDAPHEAMYVTLTELGSLVVDIDGNELHAVFIDDMGTVRDDFSIHKTPDSSPPLIASARAEDAIHVIAEFTEPLDVVSAVTPSNYSIPGLLITAVELLEGDRSVRLTTSVMSTSVNYVLTVNNVMDRIGNAILPDSQYGFYFIEEWTISFQDQLLPTTDYAGTFDTIIREASATTNYGSAVTLEVDGDEPSGAGTDMYILIGWDVSYIPPTANIDSARIHFNATNPGGPYSCYGLLRAWVESEATWNEASSGTSWLTAGALDASDRGNTVLCTFSAATGSLSIDLNADGIALVQSWVDGSAGNHGIVISDPGTSNGVDMDSRESSGAMNRPRLEVTYSFSAPNQAPGALFSYDCMGLWCSFTDTSADVDGTVVSWAWDFGDGIISGARNPLHQFAGDGTYAVSLTVSDNDGAVDPYNLEVTVSATTASSAIDVPISSGSDDVEQKLSDGSMYMDSSDLELGDDLATNGEQTVGLRFNNIGIPHAATITSSYISFTGDEASADATSIQFYAEDTDNAAPFSTSNNDLTNRSKTSAVVNWNNIPSWVVNDIYPSPDLSTIVQEVVNRPGWLVNNSMAFVIPGTGRRTAEAFDGELQSAAVLHVEFEGGSCSASRTLVANRWETFALPCDPGVNNQVQQVLSTLAATGAYDVTWVVWRYNEGGGTTYTKLAVDDNLLPGYGYWIYTLNSVSINFVGEFNNLPGRALSTDPVNGSLSFVGNYRNEAVSWPEVVVSNGSSEVNIAGADPLNNTPPPVAYECDMSPAGDDCLVSRKSYWWSGSNYDTFSALIPGMEGEIPVGHAIFVKAFAPGSSLHLPTGLGTSSFSENANQVSVNGGQAIEEQQLTQNGSPALASNKVQQTRQPQKNAEPWLVRIIVSSGEKQDRGNVLGRLPDSEDGADLNDVEELAPFGSNYLSLTFDNPQLPAVSWGYTSDFRAPAKHAKGEWPILIRASSDVGEITLSWEGIEGPARKVWVRDEQTGLEHRLKADSEYKFQNVDGVNRFSIIVR